MDNVLNKISYGLYVLSTKCYKKDNACIINTVTQIANNPDTISISVNKNNHTCKMLEYTDDFNISILSIDATFEIFKQFGFQSGRELEKFENFDDKVRTPNGIYIITKGTNAYISCKIIERIDMGSHILFIAHITDSSILSDSESLTYSYYHKNIKPKPVETKNNGKTIYRCEICGYEIETEELDDDFVCPICKHPKSDFVKITK